MSAASVETSAPESDLLGLFRACPFEVGGSLSLTAAETRLWWAAAVLSADVRVADSILLGRPVMVRKLDPEALRRALRGSPPPLHEFITLTADHLAALDECGPILEKRRPA